MSPGIYVNNLDPYTAYEFNVVSATSAGSTSSDWIRYITSQAAPSDVQDPRMYLSRTHSLSLQLLAPLTPNGDVTSQSIYIDGANVGTFDPDSLVIVAGLNPHTEYTVMASVCTSAGCSNSTGVGVSTATDRPDGIPQPAATERTSNTIGLVWTEPTLPNGVITGYTVWRQTMESCDAVSRFAAPVPAEQQCGYVACSADEGICGTRCYDPSQYTCCDNMLHDTVAGQQCCGETYVVISSSQVCCGNSTHTAQSGHTCCGDGYSSISSNEICCEGTVGVGNSCCDATPYASTDAAPRTCCNSRVYSAAGGRSCCGQDMIAPTQTCCEDGPRARAYTPQDGASCCGAEMVFDNVTECCDGAPHFFASSVAKDDNTAECCGRNLIAEGLGCCGGQGYNVDERVCADRATEGNDLCGGGVNCPLSASGTSFCDMCNFDGDHVCHAVAPEQITAALETSLRHENGGLVHTVSQDSEQCELVVCAADEQACSGVCHGDDKVCCGGVLHNFEANNRCCGEAYARPGAADDVCCSGTFHTREADKQCCSDSYTRVASGEICCEGTVSTGTQCCGSSPFTDSAQNPQICCGGDLLERDGAQQCCGGDIVASGLICCGDGELGSAYRRSQLMMCCGNGYVPSATTLCCEGSDSETIGYSYSSPGERLLSGDTCCGSNQIADGESCCNGVPYDATEATCADAGFASSDPCGTGVLCAANAGSAAQCGVCDFDPNLHSCSLNTAVAANAAPLRCPVQQRIVSRGTTTAVSVENLEPYSMYRFLLGASTSAGTSRGSPSDVIWTLEASPDNLLVPTVTAIDSGSVRIAWRAPGSPNGAIIAYRIKQDGTVLIESTAVGSADVAVDGGPHTSITVTLEVCNDGGCTSSSEVTGNTAPGAPELLGLPTAAAVIGGVALEVEWNRTSPSRGPIAQYVLYVNGSSHAVQQSNATTIEGLEPYSLYNLTLLSCTTGACSSSTAVFAWTLHAPPSGLTAPQLYVVGSRRVEVAWIAPETPNGVIFSYRIHRNGDLLYNSTNVSVLDFVDTSPAANTVHSYTQTACTAEDTCTESPASVINTPESAPDDFATPTCVAESASTIRMTWEAPETPNGRITEYRVRSVAQGEGNGTRLQMRRSYLHEGLSPFTEYAFRAVACTLAGCTVSEACTLTTLEALPVGQGQPVIEVQRDSTISVSWEPPEQPNGVIIRYVLEETGAESDDTEVTLPYDGNGTSFVHQGLQAYSVHRYRVTSYNSVGTVTSGYAQARTSPSQPAGVQNPTFGVPTATYALVSWEPPSSPNGIIVRYLLVDQSDWLLPPIVFYNGSALQANITLEPNTNYSISLRAHTTAGGTTGNATEIRTPEAAPEGVGTVVITSLEARETAMRWGAPTSSHGIITQYILTAHHPDGETEEVYTGLDMVGTASDLLPFTEYTFYLTACTAAGCTQGEGRATTTLEGTAEGVATPTASALSQTSVVVQWVAPATPNGVVRRYEIYRVGMSDEAEEETLVYNGTDMSYTDRGLAPYAAAVYFVVAVNGAGGSAGDNSEMVRTFESAPVGMAAPAVSHSGHTQLGLAWSEPTRANGGIIRYIVFGRLLQDTPIEPTQFYDGPATEFVVTGLLSMMSYEFKVQAFNSMGSTTSVYASLQTCSPAPRGQAPPDVAVLTDTSLMLDWDPPSQYASSVSEYRLYMDDQLLYTGSSSTFTAADLSPSTTYAFSITSCRVSHCADAHACTTSHVASASTAEGAPQGVRRPHVFALSSTAMEVMWTEPVRPNGVISSYELFRDATSVYTGLAVEFIDTNLNPNTTYSYTLVARTSGGATASPLATTSTQIAGSPEGVRTPSARILSATIFQVCWEAVEDTGTDVGYQILLNNVEYREAPLNRPDRLCSFLENLRPFTEYGVRVAACYGESCAFSRAISARTECGSPQSVAPSGEVFGTAIVLEWDLPEVSRCSVTTYAIEYTVDDPARAPRITTVDAGVSDRAILSELAYSTLHFIRVVSTNDVGSSTGAWITLSTVEGAPAGLPPPEVVGSDGTTDVAVLWQPPITENGDDVFYTLIVRNTQDGTTSVAISDVRQTTAAAGNLDANTAYEFVVQACTAVSSTPTAVAIVVDDNEASISTDASTADDDEAASNSTSRPTPAPTAAPTRLPPSTTRCTVSDATQFTSATMSPEGVQPPNVTSVDSGGFTVEIPLPLQPNGDITMYVVEYKACIHPCEDALDTDVEASAVEPDAESDVTTGYIMASAATTYSVRVIASTSAGNGSSSWTTGIETGPGVAAAAVDNDLTAGESGGVAIAVLFALMLLALMFAYYGYYGNVPTWWPESRLKSEPDGWVGPERFWVHEEEAMEKTPRINAQAVARKRPSPNKKRNTAGYNLADTSSARGSMHSESVVDDEMSNAVPVLTKHTSYLDIGDTGGTTDERAGSLLNKRFSAVNLNGSQPGSHVGQLPRMSSINRPNPGKWASEEKAGSAAAAVAGGLRSDSLLDGPGGYIDIAPLTPGRDNMLINPAYAASPLAQQPMSPYGQQPMGPYGQQPMSPYGQQPLYPPAQSSPYGQQYGSVGMAMSPPPMPATPYGGAIDGLLSSSGYVDMLPPNIPGGGMPGMGAPAASADGYLSMGAPDGGTDSDEEDTRL